MNQQARLTAARPHGDDPGCWGGARVSEGRVKVTAGPRMCPGVAGCPQCRSVLTPGLGSQSPQDRAAHRGAPAAGRGGRGRRRGGACGAGAGPPAGRGGACGELTLRGLSAAALRGHLPGARGPTRRPDPGGDQRAAAGESGRRGGSVWKRSPDTHAARRPLRPRGGAPRERVGRAGTLAWPHSGLRHPAPDAGKRVTKDGAVPRKGGG